MLPTVALVFTGGTISMKPDATGGAVPALSGADILTLVPELAGVAALRVVEFGKFPGPHMTPERMLSLVRTIRELLTDPTVAGVVVTHGTDAMEETAYLADLLIDTDRPVVFTGAMRTSADLGWDGPTNLFNAVRVAIDPAARGLGVVIGFGGELFAASEASKRHTERTSAFGSDNFGPLGAIEGGTVVIYRRPLHRTHLPVEQLEANVDLIKCYAGMDGRFIRCAVESGAKGLVVEGMGRGNVPVPAYHALVHAMAGGLPVVLVSRCIRGRTLPTYGYEGGGRQLQSAGAMLVSFLNGPKARIKLMAALGSTTDPAELRRLFTLEPR